MSSAPWSSGQDVALSQRRPAVGDARQISKFWSRVDRSGGPDACWPWTGARHPKGYGLLPRRTAPWTAHALSLVLSVGPRPTGLQAAHACHNKLCCNPRHLRWATQVENAQDNVRAGRHAHGERGSKAKLTAHIVAECRRRRAAGETCQALADEFGVTRRAMSFAVSGVNWAHLPGAVVR